MPRRNIALDNWGSSDGVTSNKFHFQRGELLFGKLRPYFHKVGAAATDGVCSTDILVLTPKEEHWFGIVLGYVSSDELVQYADAGSTGTKMPRTNWNDLARYEVVLPPEPIAKAFAYIARSIVNRISANIHHAHALAGLRDALLPRLLSGELRLKEAEKLLV
jgi:type I restriction enzyme S subunit